ncbi:MAG: outer-membrane lipoprotein carrier protein LolA [Deltaproteobacteria bacterium]|jgi:outer membrane lipoprotein-sorting protein|nr:outer-membrane lipoprotein carrier protein LolA [Deltaproteobacteria bacterium]
MSITKREKIETNSPAGLLLAPGGEKSRAFGAGAKWLRSKWLMAKAIGAKAVSLVFLAGVMLVLSPPSLMADKAGLERALAGLSKRYVGLESFSANYSRTTTTPAMDNIFRTQANQTATGVIQWKQLSKLRLDQNLPSQEALMTDGETVWWYMPTDKQVRVYRDLDLAGELAPLLTFMSGLNTLKEKFNIKEATKEDVRKGQTGLILEEKGGSDESGQIIIYCDKNFVLTGFRLSSLTGEKTDFFLEDQKVNPGFDDKLFVFVIPRGTIVIEETEG